jgi:hypothetical protein
MAKVQQYGDLYRMDMNRLVAPIPRYYLKRDEMPEGFDMADEIQRLYTFRKAQMSTVILRDMRLLRWFDPEKLQDQWQNVWTGRPLSKLYHSSGLAVEIFNWTKPVVESLTGLMAGYKPMAYRINVPPEDPAAESDILQSDIIEKLILRRARAMDPSYSVSYMDHVSNVMSMGRGCKYTYWNDEEQRPIVENLWPGFVADYWQRGARTLEQVVVASEMSAGEACELYPEYEDEIMASLVSPTEGYGATISHRETNRSPFHHVTVLNFWARLGSGRIGMWPVLAGDKSGRSARGSLLLEKYVTKNSGYDDIPVRITPRFKIMDKPPSEATGALHDVAPLNTEYNEVFSAFRDMLWRAIYQRYKAKGFTFRNAPRLIPGTGIYALPRPDQDIARIEEIVNTVPVEQFLNHLEEMIIVLPGLNRFFLGSAPPSETSGEAITAAIKSSITRLEPVRTNVGEDELWMYRMWLGFEERFASASHAGYTISMAQIIEGKRDVELKWSDITPREATKEKQLALAGSAAGKISDDTVMDAWDIVSKPDEVRKIRKERQDPIMHPEHVSQTAAALLQMAQAKAAMRPQAQMGGPAPGGGPGNPASRGNEAARTAAAQAAPPRSEADNDRVMPPTQAGQLANMVAPAPPGQR